MLPAQRGLSLVEMLVSLLIATATTLVVLKQQWMLHQRFTQLQLRQKAHRFLDNVSESLMADFPAPQVEPPLSLMSQSMAYGTVIEITWNEVSSGSLNTLRRALVLR